MRAGIGPLRGSASSAWRGARLVSRAEEPCYPAHVKLSPLLALAATVVPAAALAALACTSFSAGDATTADAAATDAADAAPEPDAAPGSPADAGADAHFCEGYKGDPSVLFCADFENGDDVAPFGFPMQNGPANVYSLVSLGHDGQSLQVAVSRDGGAASLGTPGLFDARSSNVQLDFDVLVVQSTFSSLTAGAIEVAGFMSEHEYGLGCYNGATLSKSRSPGPSVAIAGWHHVAVTLRALDGGFTQHVAIDGTTVDSETDDLTATPTPGVHLGIDELGNGGPDDKATVVFDDFILRRIP